MNIQQLIVLDKTEIENSIKDYEAKIEYAEKEPLKGNIYGIEEWLTKIKILKVIHQQSKPLEPIVSNAFDAGAERGFEERGLNSQHHKDITVPTLQEYLKTFNL